MLGRQSIFLGTLLDAYDLGDHVSFLLGSGVTFIPDKTAFNEVFELPIIQKLNKSLPGESYLFNELAKFLFGELLFVSFPLFPFRQGLVNFTRLVAL